MALSQQRLLLGTQTAPQQKVSLRLSVWGGYLICHVALAAKGVEVVQADLSDPASIEKAYVPSFRFSRR